MALKDYYKILELGPEASDLDIRKAYRRLAMQHHPDKQPDDPVAEAIFREIQEAYLTLSDPVRKDAYLQLRWYEQSQGRRLTGLKALTSSNVLKELLQLDRYISFQNPYHIDRQGLQQYLLQILSPEVIELLKVEKDTGLVREVIDIALKPAHHLRPEEAALIIDQLKQLSIAHPQLTEPIAQFHKEMSDKVWWDKWRFPILAALAFLICLLIAWAA